MLKYLHTNRDLCISTKLVFSKQMYRVSKFHLSFLLFDQKFFYYFSFLYIVQVCMKGRKYITKPKPEENIRK